MLSEVTKNNPGMYNDVKEGHWGATYAVRPELQVGGVHKHRCNNVLLAHEGFMSQSLSSLSVT